MDLLTGGNQDRAESSPNFCPKERWGGEEGKCEGMKTSEKKVFGRMWKEGGGDRVV